MYFYHIPKSLANELCIERYRPPKSVGNPVERKLSKMRVTFRRRSESMKRRWRDPAYRAKNIPRIIKNLIQFRPATTEKERKQIYEDQLRLIEKAAAARNKMTNTYVMRFMETYCPEVEIEPGMPLGYYEEMLEFFHPELLWKLEREWRKDFEGYIKE